MVWGSWPLGAVHNRYSACRNGMLLLRLTTDDLVRGQCNEQPNLDWGPQLYCPICACLFSLGGIPLGVIAVETRTMELTIPADPANLDSEVKVCACVFVCVCVFYWKWNWLVLKFTQLAAPALVSRHVAILVPVGIDLCRNREWVLSHKHFPL